MVNTVRYVLVTVGKEIKSFRSAEEAAKEFKVRADTIRSRCRNPNEPNWRYSDPIEFHHHGLGIPTNPHKLVKITHIVSGRYLLVVERLERKITPTLLTAGKFFRYSLAFELLWKDHPTVEEWTIECKNYDNRKMASAAMQRLLKDPSQSTLILNLVRK